ncbi:MAG: hypothetical protein AABX02_00205 [archaeon]
MKQSLVRVLDWFIRIALFVIAFGLVVIFVLALDSFVMDQRLYFLRTSNWDDLITVTVLGLLVAWVLKRLLILQFQWGFKR